MIGLVLPQVNASVRGEGSLRRDPRASLSELGSTEGEFQTFLQSDSAASLNLSSPEAASFNIDESETESTQDLPLPLNQESKALPGPFPFLLMTPPQTGPALVPVAQPAQQFAGMVSQPIANASQQAIVLKSDPEIIPANFGMQPVLNLRQQSMQKFLQKMEQEFGISEAEIVQAFADLDPTVLAGPPEEAKQEFLSNLGLPEDETPRAGELYSEMVLNTEGEEKSEKTQPLPHYLRPIPKAGLSARELSQERNLRSVDLMNDVFADRVQYMTQEGPVQARVLAPEELDVRVMQLMQMNRQNQPVVDETSQAALPLGGAAVMIGQKTQDLKNQSLPTLATDQPAQQVKFIQPVVAQPASLESNQKPISPKQYKSQEHFSGNEKKSQFLGALAGLTAATPNAAEGASQNISTQVAPIPVADMSDKNIETIVKSAQIIAKNGGGEMKVQLHPEGMGQINLKVEVNQGQVQVQMVTDNIDTKKTLERAVDDLKTQLTHHKLHVDSLKIELSSDAGKDMKFGSQAQEQARENAMNMARDFMSQQREDRQAWLHDFMGRSGWKSYGQEPQRPEISPAEVQRPAAPQRRVERISDRRLNLVA